MALGLHRAGMRAVGFVEINPWCRQVLARHWPEVPQHDDVKTAVDWWLSEPRPRVDVVAGGYPCQPESLAGHGRSTGDARWLWPDMARVIHAVRPRYVIGENVLGHRTRGLRFVLRDLDRLGYTARPGVIAASEVGAPHIRKRIVTIAERRDLADTDQERRGRRSGPVGAQGRSEPPHGGGRGRTGPVADPVSVAGSTRRPGDPGQGQSGRNADRGGLPGDLADTGRPGLQGPRQLHDPGPHRGQEPADGGWWATEPEVGRVAHGVPRRVDRLRGLGNAVVPHVAEHIGRLILSGDLTG
ncbi:DNA (cytosine-5)-methyltransferase 1 [Actinoplanes philippinensis]|uniref:DNA (cytosine-5-)-methyltransferase n=2 Tax=Actinoplanes philippinensis TaxID=35752 RepID=A0A1I2IQ43_9ACTN|nr:DNA (cytosine-5)-methyltransferase 1 [Actinoplanes philippinensis]